MLKHRRAGGAAFGLTLLAILLVGALAASAAQAATWHVDGSEYSGEESVAWTGGSTEFKSGTWKITCASTSGTSSITTSKYSSGSLTFSGCAVVGEPKCVVKPLKLSFEGELVTAGEEDYEKLKTSTAWTGWEIENCAMKGGWPVSGTIAALIGEEAVHSSRKFAHAYDVATKSSGLEFYGRTWEVTASADTTLSGSSKGSRFGTGGAWVPAEESYWTVAGKEFYGEESIKASKTGAVTISNDAEESIQCESSEGTSLKIQNENDSSGQLVFKSCSLPEYPGCFVVGNIALSTEGYIGRDVFSLARERVDVSGYVTLLGECPSFVGKVPVSGSIAASLSTNGIALKKQFNTTAESMTGAPGMSFGGEFWSVSTELETTLSGSNSGKSLGVS